MTRSPRLVVPRPNQVVLDPSRRRSLSIWRRRAFSIWCRAIHVARVLRARSASAPPSMRRRPANSFSTWRHGICARGDKCGLRPVSARRERAGGRRHRGDGTVAWCEPAPRQTLHRLSDGMRMFREPSELIGSDGRLNRSSIVIGEVVGMGIDDPVIVRGHARHRPDVASRAAWLHGRLLRGRRVLPGPRPGEVDAERRRRAPRGRAEGPVD